MSFEDVNIQVAVIALMSALLGAVVTAFVNYWFQQRYESKKQIREKQKEVYYNFLNALQALVNDSSSRTIFYDFQKAVNAVCLYGDNKTSLAVKEYYEALVDSANNNTRLTSDEHTVYGTKIINAMRKSLKLNEFDEFNIIRLSLPEKK